MNKVLETVRDYWLEFFLAGIAAAITSQWKRIRASQLRKQALEAGVRELLGQQIIELCHNYASRDKLPLYARRRVTALLAPYVGLGGNGDVRTVAEQLLAKPDDDGRSDEKC